MSDAKMKSEPHYKQRWLQWANPAEPNSRKWFWQMRLLNINVWLAPPIVLLAAVNYFQSPGVEDPSIGERLMFSLPWVAVALAAGGLAYALWRIEVNMEGGERPFTERDEAVYQRAFYIQAILGSITMFAFMVLLFYTLFHGIATDENSEVGDRLTTIFNALYAPMAAIYLLGMFTRTLSRMYAKARKGYEELEKGV